MSSVSGSWKQTWGPRNGSDKGEEEGAQWELRKGSHVTAVPQVRGAGCSLGTSGGSRVAFAGKRSFACLRGDSVLGEQFGIGFGLRI